VLRLKWHDWGLALDLGQLFRRSDAVKGWLFASLRRTGKLLRRETAYTSLISDRAVCSLLSRYSRRQPVLSNRQTSAARTERLLELLDQLKHDVRSHGW